MPVDSAATVDRGAASRRAPKVSVVIPTRNRPQYLMDSVRVALDSGPNTEVVIADNSDTDELRGQLADLIAQGHVIYDHSAELRSVVQNFEHALKLTTGDWLIFIGDDDAVGPGLHDVAAWADANQVEAVVSYRDTFTAAYYWPGVRSKYYGDAYSSRLFIWPFTGKATPIDGVAELRRVSQRFGGNLGCLPRAYHGLVSRSLLNRIRERHGYVFGGVSPDIFSAALISAHSRRSMLVDFPFVIPGASGSSTAGQGAERSDRAKLRATDHIARFGSGLQWDHRIPEFYSPQTVWAFSLLKALEELPELSIRPSFGRLYARCLLFCRAYTVTTWQTMLASSNELGSVSLFASTLRGIALELSDLTARLGKRLLAPRAMGNAERIEGLQTISAAYLALSEYVARPDRQLQLQRLNS